MKQSVCGPVVQLRICHYMLRMSMRRMICLPVPPLSAVWCSVLRADAVLWLFPLRSPPTAHPNDNNVAVIRYSGQAWPKNITTYDRRRKEYDRGSDVLPIEASNAGSTVRHLCLVFLALGTT
jgi:hypothetical protein